MKDDLVLVRGKPVGRQHLREVAVDQERVVLGLLQGRAEGRGGMVGKKASGNGQLRRKVFLLRRACTYAYLR